MSTSVTASLKQLDKTLIQRILKRVQWIADNFEQTEHIQLTGTYAGLFRFRIGDYRLIYSVNHEEKFIFLVDFGHRKDVYRNH